MKKLYIKHGYYAKVDDEDFNRVSKYNWRLTNDNFKQYLITNIKGKQVMLHRFILNPPKGKLVRFKNDNTFDCRKENLEIISRELCSRGNKKIRYRKGKKCTSVFKGVHFYKKNEKWRAFISINGKAKYLGAFDDEIDAAIEYNKAVRKIAGKYAYQNIPTVDENGSNFNLTEAERLKKAKTSYIPLGEILKNEILCNLDEEIRKYPDDGSKIMFYGDLRRKLRENNFEFNIYEIECVFRNFPSINNFKILKDEA